MTIKEIYNSISKSEWKMVHWLIIAMILITTIPILFGYFNAPENKVVSGLNALTPIDMNVYYSYIEQAKQGRIIFTNLFTAEYQKPLVLNIFWLGVGLMGKIFNTNSILTFQLARIILLTIFIYIIYFFISYFFYDKKKRKASIFFILFSSGVGAMLAPILNKFVYETYGYYHWPLDLWVAESVTFLSLFHMPHFIASLILIILIFLFTLLSWEKKNLKYELIGGLCALLLFQFHPFHLPTVFGVLGAYFAWWSFVNKKILWNKLRPLIILFIFSLPNLIYHLYTLNDFIIQRRALQNVTLTPALWLTIIGYGFLIPLAIIGIYYIFKNKNSEYKKINKKYFLSIWLIIQFVLIYTPFALQRRMTEGLHIVLSLLSVIGWFKLVKYTQNKPNKNRLDKIIFQISNNKILLISAFVILFTFSNFFNVVRSIIFYKNEHILFYINKDKKEAFDWIKNNSDAQSIFLAHPTTNNFIAGNTGRFVYAGHTTETIFYYNKIRLVQWFFSNNSYDEQKLNFLKEKNINYIFYSDWEQIYNKKNQIFNPDEKNYLKLVYKNKKVNLYAVK